MKKRASERERKIINERGSKIEKKTDKERERETERDRDKEAHTEKNREREKTERHNHTQREKGVGELKCNSSLSNSLYFFPSSSS